MSKSFSYKDSGVDIDAGDRLVHSIKNLVKETHTPSVLSNIGGFGALFSGNFKDLKDPVLVSSVDGVGTKLIVAFKSGIYHTVGQDLVNHCVNDIAVCGAIPLFFLDYFSTGKLEEEVAYQVIQGFTKACKENNVALIGGETAEMPDMYKEGEFDLAGTIVGVVDKNKLVTGEKIKEGDVLIGIESSGLHTNGYSLARKVLLSHYKIDDHIPELGCSLSEALLQIHISYLSFIQSCIQKGVDKGFSHITGGGIEGNTKRILPDPKMKLEVNWDSWEIPPLFQLIQSLGEIPDDEMRRAFNLGIGLIVVAAPSQKEVVTQLASEQGFNSFEMGTIQK